jgi:hypothetical protein
LADNALLTLGRLNGLLVALLIDRGDSLGCAKSLLTSQVGTLQTSTITTKSARHDLTASQLRTLDTLLLLKSGEGWRCDCLIKWVLVIANLALCQRAYRLCTTKCQTGSSTIVWRCHALCIHDILDAACLFRCQTGDKLTAITLEWRGCD